MTTIKQLQDRIEFLEGQLELWKGIAEIRERIADNWEKSSDRWRQFAEDALECEPEPKCKIHPFKVIDGGHKPEPEPPPFTAD
jgi:hypothetical protein